MGLPVHLCGRGGPPAGLPCGSQIPTYLSLGVRSLRDLDHHVTACSEGARACGGGGGGAGPAFGPAPFLLGGVGAAKGLLPCFLVPKRNQPTACTLALWWLKFGPTESGGGGGGGVGVALLVVGGAGVGVVLAGGLGVPVGRLGVACVRRAALAVLDWLWCRGVAGRRPHERPDGAVVRM